MTVFIISIIVFIISMIVSSIFYLFYGVFVFDHDRSEYENKIHMIEAAIKENAVFDNNKKPWYIKKYDVPYLLVVVVIFSSIIVIAWIS